MTRLMMVMTALLVSAASAGTQTGAMIRGTVVDAEGRPVPGVKVEIQFQGTQDVKPKTLTQTTNNRGYFTRVGLPDGPYKIVFTKEGFDPSTISTNISLGGLSDLGTVPLRTAGRGGATPAGSTASTAEPGAAAGPGAAGGAPDAAVLAKLQEQVRKTYAQAIEATDAGNYDHAEAQFKEIIAKVPSLGPAHASLAYLYRQKKDYGAAEDSYRKAIELQPESSDYYLSLAWVQQAGGNPDKAVETLTGAAAKFDSNPKFVYTSALLYYEWGKGDEAAAAFKKLRTLDPSNVEPLYYLGVLAVQKNQPQEAVPYLEQYVAGSGQNPKNLQTAQGLLKALKR